MGITGWSTHSIQVYSLNAIIRAVYLLALNLPPLMPQGPQKARKKPRQKQNDPLFQIGPLYSLQR